MPIHATNTSWVIETANTAYAFGLNEAGCLVHRYWGARLPSVNDYPPPANPAAWSSFNRPAQLTREEYPTNNDQKFIEPALTVVFADGVRVAELQYTNYAIQNDALHIELQDTYYPLRVTLVYRPLVGYDLIERSAIIQNTGQESIAIERVFSAQWHLPYGDDYRFNHLTGRWLDEFHIRREKLARGVTVTESRRLHTSHNHNPYFALDRGSADEDQGEVWFGTLAWSGNWKIAAEVTDWASTRINIGVNDWDFGWELKPDTRFTTPISFGGYTAQGFGAASRTLHTYIRSILPHGDTLHKVLYNSWEATFFNVDVESQKRYAEIARDLGVELFVVDDGWFQGRDLDNAGLGDWWPDAKKFPDGLKPLIEHVNGLGMDFGIWVEPEMVNPDSDLYRAHPDWVIHFPNRTRTENRSQLILNMARQDVQDYLIEHLDKLLTENNITFIKWDMNRTVSEPGWPAYEGEQREIWVRYVEGLYNVWGTLRQRHPNVIWQSCSGGGARADMGILRYADQIWTSDNTGGTARLAIQEGFSQVFPANTMEAWVTDTEPNLPVTFRMHVSMCGSLGIGANLTHWNADERAEAAKWIAVYKEIRPIVQLGNQYRLQSVQAGGGFSAVQYMSKDRGEGVLFAFRTHIPDPINPLSLRLRGLDPLSQYTVEGFEGSRSGAAWMQTDSLFTLKNFESTVRRIRQVG
ncbi:MAG: alpha-galactosidase [Chloroflexi bacterium]|nr:alpha-galactosidase [Chloroflexota bacterium]